MPVYNDFSQGDRRRVQKNSDTFYKTGTNKVREERFSATYKFTRVSASAAAATQVKRTAKGGTARIPSNVRSGTVGGRSSALGGAPARGSLPVPVRGAPTQKRKNLRISPSAQPVGSGESGVALIRKRLIASRMPKMHTVNARVVRPFPIRLVFLAILCTVLFMVIIYNNVQINEKSADIEAVEDEIESIDKEINHASLAVEKKNDLRYIEQRALELGMVKADQLEKQYVTISSFDKVELVNDEEKEEDEFRMTGIFETIRDKLTELIENIK